MARGIYRNNAGNMFSNIMENKVEEPRKVVPDTPKVEEKPVKEKKQGDWGLIRRQPLTSKERRALDRIITEAPVSKHYNVSVYFLDKQDNSDEAEYIGDVTPNLTAYKDLERILFSKGGKLSVYVNGEFRDDMEEKTVLNTLVCREARLTALTEDDKLF